jgi:hypothetical protein
MNTNTIETTTVNTIINNTINTHFDAITNIPTNAQNPIDIQLDTEHDINEQEPIFL